MPNYDYLCNSCDLQTILFAKYEDRDTAQACPMCEGTISRAFLTVPQVRTEKLSKSFIDGTRPKSHGFDEWKKIAKLEQKIADTGSQEEKTEYKKEIHERKKIKR